MAETPAEVAPELEELRPLLYSRGLTVALPRNGLPEQTALYRYRGHRRGRHGGLVR